MADETLIDKIRSLPPEKLAGVEDFVDFLKMRDEDRFVTLAATKLSEDSFRRVWDNPDDAEYDRLSVRRSRSRPFPFTDQTARPRRWLGRPDPLNVSVVTADVDTFAGTERFDRVVSVENAGPPATRSW